MMTRRDFAKSLAALPLLTLIAPRRAAAAGPRYRGPVSDHFDGKRFFNPGGQQSRSFGDLLRWQLGGGKVRWPRRNPSPFTPDRPPATVDRGLRVVLVGHATFLIQGGGLNVLVDPVWSERASPLGFAGPSRHNAPGIAFGDLPRIDVVLVSHNHYDHLDQATLRRLWRRDRPRFVAPLGNEGTIRDGDESRDVVTADWGDTVELGAHASVRLERAHHWSTRGFGDRNRALWCAFTLRIGNALIYIAGDTGFADGSTFAEAARNAGAPIDLALLPIGAYEPRWFMSAQHINPAEAVKAFKLLDAKRALGCHWGTFQLTNEGVHQPARDLAAALAVESVEPERFLAARPGQVWTDA